MKSVGIYWKISPIFHTQTTIILLIDNHHIVLPTIQRSRILYNSEIELRVLRLQLEKIKRHFLGFPVSDTETTPPELTYKLLNKNSPNLNKEMNVLFTDSYFATKRWLHRKGCTFFSSAILDEHIKK